MNISNGNFRLGSFHSSGVSWLYPFTAMCRSAFSISDFRTICLPNITPIHLFQNEQVLSTSSSQFTVWRKNSLYENLIISYIVKYAKLYYFCDTI